MANNHGRTRPERALAKSLWGYGLRYLTHEGYGRKYRTRLPGRPDLIFPKKRTVVFVDGCFWHGCEKCGKTSGYMNDFWLRKIAGNVVRDRAVTSQLELDGWKVLRIPEHIVRTKASLVNTSLALRKILKPQASNLV